MGTVSLTDAGGPVFFLTHRGKEHILLLVTGRTSLDDVKLRTKKEEIS